MESWWHEQRVRERAYEIWQKAGCPEGASAEHWLQAEAEIFGEVLIEGRQIGAFHVPDPKAAAYALLLATNALMPFSLSPQELGARDEIERKVSQVADLLLYGVLRRGPGEAL